MALEKAKLSDRELAAFLAAQYGVRVGRIQRLAMGSANCYKVETDAGEAFCKEFQSDVAPQDICDEAQVLDRLQSRGFPVVPLIKTTRGEPYARHAERIFSLQPFVQGKNFGYDDFPQEMMGQAARLLGKMHIALQGMDLPVRMGKEWFASFSPEALAAQYQALRAQVRPDDRNAGRISHALEYKTGLALRCAKYGERCAGMRYGATHGDYLGCQLICDGDEIKAVIDFSSARTLPLAWEVMRSFAQTSVKCRKEARVPLEDLCDYVREYLREAPLTREDLRAMPWIYLFCLARSKYGFRQYIKGESEDSAALLEFALWRTQMCRELEERGERISAELETLL